MIYKNELISKSEYDGLIQSLSDEILIKKAIYIEGL